MFVINFLCSFQFSKREFRHKAKLEMAARKAAIFVFGVHYFRTLRA